MSFTKDEATAQAKRDLAGRLNVDEASISGSAVDKEFPDASLGAAVNGEMSAQMISSGWQINLKVDGKPYEYRADKYQLRLHNFNGENYVIK